MLKVKALFVMLASLVFFTSLANGSEIKVKKLTNQVYRLTSTFPYPSNFLAYVSKEGILLIDSGQIETGLEIRKILKKIAPENSEIKYLINTHAHRDHTGGNFALAGEPIIMGSRHLKNTLKSFSYVLLEYPENALPQISFEMHMTLEFGGEQFKMHAIPGAHDRTDIMIHLVNSKIVCLGDVAYGMSFPSYDGYTGNLLNYPSVLDRVIELIPKDVTIVSGHGDETSVGELKVFQKMILDTTNLVKAELDKGESVQNLIGKNILEAWSGFDKGLGTDLENWIRNISRFNTGKKINRSLCGELYQILTNNDASQAINRYHELKKFNSTEFSFSPWHLYQIGAWLLDKGRIGEARLIFKFMFDQFKGDKYLEGEINSLGYKYMIKRQYEAALVIFKSNAKANPRSANVWDSLAETYMKKGDINRAIKFYKKTLKINPKNPNAKNNLKILEK